MYVHAPNLESKKWKKRDCNITKGYFLTFSPSLWQGHASTGKTERENKERDRELEAGEYLKYGAEEDITQKRVFVPNPNRMR